MMLYLLQHLLHQLQNIRGDATMPNQYENFSQDNTETFYLSDFEIPEAPDTWDLQDFEDLLQETRSY
jgi:hypothetical protein